VTVTLKSGDRFAGIWAGTNLPAANSKMTIKMAKKLAHTTSNGVVNQDPGYTGPRPDHSMTFDVKDIADLEIPNFSAPETAKSANGESDPPLCQTLSNPERRCFCQIPNRHGHFGPFKS
jgi:hypothetical protein